MNQLFPASVIKKNLKKDKKKKYHNLALGHDKVNEASMPLPTGKVIGAQQRWGRILCFIMGRMPTVAPW